MERFEVRDITSRVPVDGRRVVFTIVCPHGCIILLANDRQQAWKRLLEIRNSDVREFTIVDAESF